jgi:hypothetical protein
MLLLTVLTLANSRDFGRTHLLSRAVMLSEAKHLWITAVLIPEINLRFFTSLRMTTAIEVTASQPSFLATDPAAQRPNSFMLTFVTQDEADRSVC